MQQEKFAQTVPVEVETDDFSATESSYQKGWDGLKAHWRENGIVPPPKTLPKPYGDSFHDESTGPK